jgi:carboxypeptidase family protein
MQGTCYNGRVRYLLIALIAAARIAAGATTTATIKGTITDVSRGSALPSMIAAAYTATGELQGTASSDARGDYILNLQPGHYRVLAYDPNGAFATEFGGNADSFDSSPIVNLATSLTGVNFGMEKAGTVSGTVRSSGSPLSSITIAAYNVGTGTRRGFVQTAPDGSYSVELAPGQYKIAAYDDTGRYSVAFFPNALTFDSAGAVSLASSQQVTADFDLPYAGHLSGTVIDATTNVVLAGATVLAYTANGAVIASTLSDAAGNFAVPVPPGSYKLVAADASHVYASGFVDDANSFVNERTVTVSASQLVSAIRIPMHRSGAVSGRVKDAAGTALTGMTIAAYNNDGSQRASTATATNGAYTLFLPPGDFRIAAYDPARVFVTQFYPQRAFFSSATSLTVNVAQTTPSIDFTLGRGARFNGTIVDAATNTPVDGISVGAYDDNGNLMNLDVTDGGGDYTLVVPSGRFKLAAFDNGLRYVTGYGGGSPNYDNAVDFQADGTATVRVDFSLTRGVHITGTVLDAAAAFVPVSSVEVGVLDAEGNRVATTTTHDGRFDLVLVPGSYRLLAVDPLGRYYASFYNGAWTLQTASAVIVGVNGLANPITMTLVPVSRRHPAHH